MIVRCRACAILVAWGALVLGTALAQTKPPTDPAVMATVHRLVLTDSSYQMVREWHVTGDRVRYISTERNGEWEEMPTSLVDWAATLQYAHAHTPLGREEAGESADAKAIDAEEAAERAANNARTPEVLPHLNLPDRDGVWVLDYFQNAPELVTLEQNSGDINQRTGHNVLRAAINPMASRKQEVRLEGEGSKVHLHGSKPVFYVSLTTPEEEAAADALAIETHGAKPSDAASSPKSQYAIVAVEPRRNYRVVTSVNLSALGRMTQSQDIVPATATILPGGRWMKVQPRQPLTVGQYALMEVLKPGEVNLSVWDFAIDPQSGDNPNAILPMSR